MELSPNPHWTRACKFVGNSFDVNCVGCISLRSRRASSVNWALGDLFVLCRWRVGVNVRAQAEHCSGSRPLRRQPDRNPETTAGQHRHIAPNPKFFMVQFTPDPHLCSFTQDTKHICTQKLLVSCVNTPVDYNRQFQHQM